MYEQCSGGRGIEQGIHPYIVYIKNRRGTSEAHMQMFHFTTCIPSALVLLFHTTFILYPQLINEANHMLHGHANLNAPLQIHMNVGHASILIQALSQFGLQCHPGSKQLIAVTALIDQLERGISVALEHEYHPNLKYPQRY